MVALLALPVAIIVSLCWYLPIVRAQGANRALNRSDYLRVALLYGFCFSCLLIIITEIGWDVAWRIITGSKTRVTLFDNFMSDFFRAALLEELFKFLGFKLAKNSIKPRRKIDFMLIAGMIGLVYGVVEKAVSGSIAGVLVGLAIPMHITWQLNQGGHYFEYERLKATGNQADAKRELLIALLGTFLFHGLWDFGLDVSFALLEMKQMLVSILGGALILAMVVGGVIYCVRTVRKAMQIARRAPAAQPSASHEHAWGAPTYTWASDNSTCTATRTCEHDASHVETETVTATASGTTLTATFTNPAFETQRKTIAASDTANTTKPAGSQTGTKTATTTKTASPPKTGDDTATTGIALLSAAGFCLLLAGRRTGSA